MFSMQNVLPKYVPMFDSLASTVFDNGNSTSNSKININQLIYYLNDHV